MFDWLKALRGRRAERKLMAWHTPGRPVWSARDPSVFAREGYAKNAVAYRCVRLIAEAAASAPLRVGPSDHPLAALLARPNPEQTGVELLEAFFGHLQVSGNTFLEAAAIGDAPPRELYVLRPDRMSVIPGLDGWPIGWEHRVSGNVRRFERDPVSNDAPILHLKLFHPNDDHYGLSPMEAAAFAVDRWDDGNVVRIKLYAGALESVTKEAALAGSVNVFAIEGDDGAWEIVQARDCTLVAPGEYELSHFLRGLCDSSHAQGAPTPAGRRIVKLDQRLARLTLAAHEYGDALAFIAPPSGSPPDSAAAAAATQILTHVALRPFRPVHLRAKRDGAGDVAVTWIRQARAGGLSWGPGEPPLGEPAERYVVDILDGAGAVVRSEETAAPPFIYSSAAQTADFGAPQSSLRVRIGQIGADGLSGLKTERTLPL